jgi:hypothetical protein
MRGIPSAMVEAVTKRKGLPGYNVALAKSADTKLERPADM